MIFPKSKQHISDCDIRLLTGDRNQARGANLRIVRKNVNDLERSLSLLKEKEANIAAHLKSPGEHATIEQAKKDRTVHRLRRALMSMNRNCSKPGGPLRPR